MIGVMIMGKSLSEMYPELAEEWSDRNLPLRPDQITYGSNKRVWWRGKCGHEWETSVKARTSGERCPYCSGKRVLIGFNDLETIAPGLAGEWSEKNPSLTPRMMTAGSHKKVWWLGKCGHEWKAVVKNRVGGAGCPYCSSNRLLPGFNDLATVYPEIAAEWSDRNLPLKPSEVAPFANRKAWWKCRVCGNEWETLISIRSGGSTCPYCSGIRFLPGFNDLATTHLELAAEWSERNGELTPDTVNSLSRRNVWWRCRECGHEWQSVIYTRVNGGRCPVCEGREVKPGFNDLKTTDPKLCREWDPVLNGDLTPDMVHRWSCRIVWWKGGCGHSWRGKIADRVFHNQGCIKCDKAFHQILPYLMVLYYSWEQGVQVIPNESKIIGTPLDFYFPEFRGAFIFSRKGQLSQEGTKTEQVKDYLCQRKQIKLTRIIEPGFQESGLCYNIRQMDESDAALADAITEAFHYIGIHVDIQIERDLDILFECFLRWRNVLQIQN